MSTLNLTTLTLAVGSHNPDSSEMCLLEAASYQAGEPWSDRPQCVSPVLAAYGRNLNDVLPENTRQRLVPFIPRLLNTAGDGLDEQRSYLALDWMVRTSLPAWMRLVPALTAQADLLAASPEVVDRTTAAMISMLVREAVSQAIAAWTEAEDTSGGAAIEGFAWDAAWVTAGAVERVAGVTAGVTAAQDVAWDAAWTAARTAAETVPALTVAFLQDSAIDLFDRMLSVTK